MDGIETTDDEFTKDNKKRPSRYRIIQQREGEVNGRDEVISSLGKAKELKKKIGSDEVKPNYQNDLTAIEEPREELREQLLKNAGRENVNWDSVVEVQASKNIFVESSSLASGWLIECPSHAESPGSDSPF